MITTLQIRPLIHISHIENLRHSLSQSQLQKRRISKYSEKQNAAQNFYIVN